MLFSRPYVWTQSFLSSQHHGNKGSFIIKCDKFHQSTTLQGQCTIHANFTNLQFSSNRMANVVELKVGLHCDECIKKILKAIKKIQDIETYDIDTQLNKVTVTGNVSSEEVIRVIHKIGKTATTWEAEGDGVTC